MHRTDPDPFNHGTTSIGYDEIDFDEARGFARIVEQGWGISDSQQVRRLSSPGQIKLRDNFRVDTAESGAYFLKKSHVNDPEKQDLINRTIEHVGDRGVAVSLPLQGVDGQSFYQTPDGIFCLYDFLSGEHYDGSQLELENIAIETAFLHEALADLPPELDHHREIISSHDSTRLIRLLGEVKQRRNHTGFDLYVLDVAEEIVDASREASASRFGDLPFQAVHYDLHPHNALFDGTGLVEAITDFDFYYVSQRARDVGFTMHRFARTFGSETERQMDTGADIGERAELFLSAYYAVNPMTSREIDALPLIIQDEALSRMLLILDWHYSGKSEAFDYDLEKQLMTLREARSFSF